MRYQNEVPGFVRPSMRLWFACLMRGEAPRWPVRVFFSRPRRGWWFTVHGIRRASGLQSLFRLGPVIVSFGPPG